MKTNSIIKSLKLKVLNERLEALKIMYNVHRPVLNGPIMDEIRSIQEQIKQLNN